jgi:N5-(cytidine 5'-diphosphoramidyl)-L-glutamine hydrolase
MNRRDPTNRRIAITQRVELVAAHGERRDCLDQNWTRLLAVLELRPVPVPNELKDPAGWLADLALGGLILSGGNDIAHLPTASRPAPERDRTEAALLAAAAAAKLPVLGVCRGLQLMNLHLGGRLERLAGHVAVRHQLHACEGSALDWPLADLPDVNSFHEWAIPRAALAPMLEAIAVADDDTVEAARHRALPWLGIMWHPEREAAFTAPDLSLLRRHFLESDR